MQKDGYSYTKNILYSLEKMFVLYENRGMGVTKIVVLVTRFFVYLLPKKGREKLFFRAGGNWEMTDFLLFPFPFSFKWLKIIFRENLIVWFSTS